MRDQILGRFTDKQRGILLALDALFNPSTWKSKADVMSDSFAQKHIDFLCDTLSDVKVFVNGLNHDPKSFPFITRAGVETQLDAWKMVALGIAESIQQQHDKSRQAEKRKQPSSTSSANLKNPILKSVERHSVAYTGRSAFSESFVTASSFNFAPSSSSSSNSRSGHPFPNVSMEKFIEEFHRRPDHRDYKDLCVLMQIAITLLIHTTTNERSFSLLHLIMNNLRNRITVPLLDALMRISMYSVPLTDEDFAHFVTQWYSKKTRRVSMKL